MLHDRYLIATDGVISLTGPSFTGQKPSARLCTSQPFKWKLVISENICFTNADAFIEGFRRASLLATQPQPNLRHGRVNKNDILQILWPRKQTIWKQATRNSANTPRERINRTGSAASPSAEAFAFPRFNEHLIGGQRGNDWTFSANQVVNTSDGVDRRWSGSASIASKVKSSDVGTGSFVCSSRSLQGPPN